ncbi:Nucleoside diphosphate kinase [Aphis craccivora]|uniref:Nucleoside diphosphate kinase n=1 Tax=Aphis craccivora TaxID=307492 RepID=A0A6G0VT75_APHCR|nr:Nucleoside diphosphate kinase [Aphis craccivora]
MNWTQDFHLPDTASASTKATEFSRAIGRLVPNIGDPSQAKRALLGSVTNSKWLNAAQRTTALRTIQGYRTISADTLSVLSRLLPADI